MGVESVQKNGKICILDIDVQGAELVKKSSLNVRTKEATVLGECLLLLLFFTFSDTVFSNDMNIFARILDDKQQYVSLYQTSNTCDTYYHTTPFITMTAHFYFHCSTLPRGIGKAIEGTWYRNGRSHSDSTGQCCQRIGLR